MSNDQFDHDPEGERLPIRIDTTSNGEFSPVALTPRNIAANELAHEWASENAKRKGVPRRDFMISACGAASTLLAVNHANAHANAMGERSVIKNGGAFDIPAEAALDTDAALEALSGNEFIFDVQGHYVNPAGDWLKNNPAAGNNYRWVQKTCVQNAPTDNLDYLQCLRAEEFIKDVFLDSDTDMMVLSFVPSKRDAEPITIEEADATRRIVDAMEGDHRLMLHGRVNPNQPGDLEDMDRLAADFPIAAWKTYTQWGPDGNGFFMTDDAGEAMIEKARGLGIKNICIHKGIAFGPKSFEHSLCSDIGEAAKRHPDINFILYHSGFDIPTPEEAFTPGQGKDRGMDVLCQSLIDAGVKPGSNVYAELGSTWRFLMRDPDMAAHALGKLITYCGPDNVLWGTDSIWYGSPQDQIQAFRTFQISKEYQERFGYPEMTPKLRAKIFGLNAMKPYGISIEEAKKHAASDALSNRKHAYLERPNPSFTTYGPKTRREFLNFKALGG
ncbi:MAG: hypothetical protein DHS20C05_12160 [Hyphococcus sp.]|nr:MAG: hypothetical protein DHS20C05_12160 [Marinicaulis sp.]